MYYMTRGEGEGIESILTITLNVTDLGDPLFLNYYKINKTAMITDYFICLFRASCLVPLEIIVMKPGEGGTRGGRGDMFLPLTD